MRWWCSTQNYDYNSKWLAGDMEPFFFFSSFFIHSILNVNMCFWCLIGIILSSGLFNYVLRFIRYLNPFGFSFFYILRWFFGNIIALILRRSYKWNEAFIELIDRMFEWNVFSLVDSLLMTEPIYCSLSLSAPVPYWTRASKWSCIRVLHTAALYTTNTYKASIWY